jgi:hypothetical protein
MAVIKYLDTVGQFTFGIKPVTIAYVLLKK